MPNPYMDRLFGMTDLYARGYNSKGENVPIVFRNGDEVKTKEKAWQTKHHELTHHKVGRDEDKVRRASCTENIDKFVDAARYN